MCSWETPFFAYVTSFYWINVALYLWSNKLTCKVFLGEKQFECIECKATFKFFFQHLWLLYVFLVRMTACTIILSDFPGIKNLNGLNDLNSLNNLRGLNDLNSLISSKKTLFQRKKNLFLMVCYFYYLKKSLKVKILRKKNILRCFANWTIDGAQHWFNKNWLGRQKMGFLRNT